MRRTIAGISKAGEQLIQQAIDATRKYHEAKDMGAPEAEVARLKLLADSLYQAVTEFQLKSRGEAGDTHH